jgi:hypothetical protein
VYGGVIGGYGADGTLSMIFAGAPRGVRFRLRTPYDAVVASRIQASPQGSQIAITDVLPYTSMLGYQWKMQTVTVANSSGISRIDYNATGMVGVVDDLLLLPSPTLVFTGTEDYTGSDGNLYTMYKLSITNSSAYPADLFAAAPDLPPCGSNPNASRTWVDIFTGSAVRIYGFCALTSPSDLNNLWFGLLKGTPPPPLVYVTLHDRLTDITYTSNQVPPGP